MSVTSGSMVMALALVLISGEPSTQQVQTDGQDGQPRDQAHPRIELFGNDVIRSEQSDNAEKEHPNRVSECDDRAQDNRVTRCATIAHQIRCDQCFAVSRRHCMQRSEKKGDPEADKDQTYRQLAMAEYLG